MFFLSCSTPYIHFSFLFLLELTIVLKALYKAYDKAYDVSIYSNDFNLKIRTSVLEYIYIHSTEYLVKGILENDHK